MIKSDTGKCIILAGDPTGKAKREALLNCPVHGEAYAKLHEKLDTALIKSAEPVKRLDRTIALSAIMEIVKRMAEVVDEHRDESS